MSLEKRARNELRDILPPPLPSFKRARCEPTKESAYPNCCRIFSWNANGIDPLIRKPVASSFDPKDTSSSLLRDFLKRHEWPEILCLQEVKINPKDDATMRIVERAANGNGVSDDGPGYSTFFSLPPDKHNAKGFGGKVYGILTIIRDDRDMLTTTDVPWDLEGRVLVTKPRSKLAMINGYWVNGTDHPYKDSHTGKIVGTRHDRKRIFHRLMLDETLSLQNQGYQVILAGDMDIARGPLDGHPNLRMSKSHVQNRTDFNSKFFISEDGMRGIDTFRHIHGDNRKYTYHGRNCEWGTSCDRVDLIIASWSLVEQDGALMEADILDSAQERGHSDHVPLFISLDLQKIP